MGWHSSNGETSGGFKLCPESTLQVTVGAASCRPCPAHFIPKYGYDGCAHCEACPEGQWTGGLEGQPECTPIPTPFPTAYPTASPTSSPFTCTFGPWTPWSSCVDENDASIVCGEG